MTKKLELVPDFEPILDQKTGAYLNLVTCPVLGDLRCVPTKEKDGTYSWLLTVKVPASSRKVQFGNSGLETPEAAMYEWNWFASGLRVRPWRV